MDATNEQRLFDAMAQVSQARDLLESAQTKLRILDNAGHISLEIAGLSIGGLSQVCELFDALNRKVQ